MQALISPNETVYSYDETPLGQRIAEVSETPFPVAQPLFWTDCPVNCTADGWYYADGQCTPKPVPPVEPDTP